MRLYRTPSGRWFGTQADARSACLDEAVPVNAWKQVDIPDDKAGLLEWLHLNCGPATVEAFRAERELDELRERDAVKATHPAHRESARNIVTAAFTLTNAEAFIQSADHRELCSLTENVILRMRELAKEAGL